MLTWIFSCYRKEGREGERKRRGRRKEGGKKIEKENMGKKRKEGKEERRKQRITKNFWQVKRKQVISKE